MKGKIPGSSLVGKTIASVDDTACNVWEVRFTDGTAITLNAVTAIVTEAGTMPGIVIEPLIVEGLNVDGQELLKLLNDRGDDCDETWGWDFHLDRVARENGVITVHFDIEHGHYVKGHRILIKDDRSFELKLEDPFWGCGADEELIPIIKSYLDSI